MENVIQYKDGYKYQLAETYLIKINIHPEKDIGTDLISLTHGGVLIIKKWYAWDGPSGPTIDTKNFMRGSLVHDALYQLIRMGLLPKEYKRQADLELKRICLEDGMWKIRAWWVFVGVDKFADYAADPKNKKQIFYAPKKPIPMTF